MNNLITALAATTLLWAGFADAHGPTRQKHEESIEINASPDKVWAVVGDFAHLEKWLPAVESSTAQGGTEKGATRELKIKGGGTLKEELLNYDAGQMTLKYKVEDPTDPKVLPVNNYSSTIKVEPAGAGSKVEWKAAYYRWFLNNNPPEGENEDAANSTVAKIYKEGLANLKAVVEGGH
jgi:carbon monoxide dehydrogenase subunit G